MGYPPYHALLDWIIFKAVLGGIANLFYAHRNFTLPVKRFVLEVIMPCVVTTCIVCIIGTVFRADSADSILVVLSKLLAMLIINIPIYYFVAMSRSEKQMIIQLIKK